MMEGHDQVLLSPASDLKLITLNRRHMYKAQLRQVNASFCLWPWAFKLSKNVTIDVCFICPANRVAFLHSDLTVSKVQLTLAMSTLHFNKYCFPSASLPPLARPFSHEASKSHCMPLWAPLTRRSRNPSCPAAEAAVNVNVRQARRATLVHWWRVCFI